MLWRKQLQKLFQQHIPESMLSRHLLVQSYGVGCKLSVMPSIHHLCNCIAGNGAYHAGDGQLQCCDQQLAERQAGRSRTRLVQCVCRCCYELLSRMCSGMCIVQQRQKSTAGMCHLRVCRIHLKRGTIDRTRVS